MMKYVPASPRQLTLLERCETCDRMVIPWVGCPDCRPHQNSRSGQGLQARAKTISPRRLQTLPPAPATEAQAERPRTRGDCIDGPRPCPWVSCRHHLALDVTRSGGLKVVRPDADGEPDLDAMQETCSLDVADRGEAGLATVGRALNVTRERARQLVEAALLRGRRHVDQDE
jgi:hypothetical protein